MKFKTVVGSQIYINKTWDGVAEGEIVHAFMMSKKKKSVVGLRQK